MEYNAYVYSPNKPLVMTIISQIWSILCNQETLASWDLKYIRTEKAGQNHLPCKS